MWPFTRRHGDKASKQNGVDTISGVGDSEFFEEVRTGEQTRLGGADSSVALSKLDRARDVHYILHKGDYRASTMDPESIDCLMARYGQALATADTHMLEKRNKERYFQRYDYESDRRFQEWKRDGEAVHERLQVHWIDDVIDKPATTLVYYLRVGVVAGTFYGIGRTTYLYRTMDKVYAKLNGVNVGKIGFHELTYAIAKGGVTAVAGTLGILAGNVLSMLLSVAIATDVHVPDRQWWHVMNCGALSGLFSGAAFTGMHYRLLTQKAMVASVVAFTAVGAAVGGYFGYRVYRPYAAVRQHRLYDAYWRPWHERRMKMEGPGNIRGRYV